MAIKKHRSCYLERCFFIAILLTDRICMVDRQISIRINSSCRTNIMTVQTD